MPEPVPAAVPAPADPVEPPPVTAPPAIPDPVPEPEPPPIEPEPVVEVPVVALVNPEPKGEVAVPEEEGTAQPDQSIPPPEKNPE